MLRESLRKLVDERCGFKQALRRVKREAHKSALPPDQRAMRGELTSGAAKLECGQSLRP